ncbi:GNAT family N-acetyltransferase [Chloroflexota bacterium]
MRSMLSKLYLKTATPGGSYLVNPTIEQIDFKKYRFYANDSASMFNRNIFCRPFWLEAWWEHFGKGNTLLLLAVKNEEQLLGLIPLMTIGKTATFMGDTDVCDYQDIIAASGTAEAVCNGLLDYAEAEGVSLFDLGHVRPESIVIKVLAEVAQNRGLSVRVTEEAVSMDMALPQSWEVYLEELTAKQKHEVERKMRRLVGGGNPDYSWQMFQKDLPELMNIFVSLFRDCDGEKGGFMNEKMAAYFSTLSMLAADEGFLRMGILKYPEDILGMILGFVDGGVYYLYNSAYSPQYKFYSAGLLSKIYGIKECIENKIETWDFLKGEEAYKRHLGGRRVPLYRCVINI